MNQFFKEIFLLDKLKEGEKIHNAIIMKKIDELICDGATVKKLRTLQNSIGWLENNHQNQYGDSSTAIGAGSGSKRGDGLNKTLQHLNAGNPNGSKLNQSYILDNNFTLKSALDVIIEFMKVKKTTVNHGRKNADKPQIFMFYYKSLMFRLTYVFTKSSAYVIINVVDIREKIMMVNLDENNKYKNHIMGSLSHELKTPLNIAITAADTIGFTARKVISNLEHIMNHNAISKNAIKTRDGPNLSNSYSIFNDSIGKLHGVDENSVKLFKACKRLDLMIDNFLDYSKIQSNTFKVDVGQVNMEQLIKEILVYNSDDIEARG
jgi:hypothetical protein